MWKKLVLIPFLTLIISCSSPYTLLQRADKLVQDKKYDDAIAVYREHINFRLNTPNRPEWENPYFHLLQIGDLQLMQGKIAEALATYEAAEKNGVDELNVSDRYRNVASVYEREGKLEAALEVLTKYRDRDPFLYDLVRDRIAKKLVQQEELNEKAAHR